MATVVWSDVQRIRSRSYLCAYCGRDIATDRGYEGELSEHDPGIGTVTTPLAIALCHHCDLPTFVMKNGQIPAKAFGERVEAVPEDVERLYEEARRCAGQRNYTAALMVGRKVLMNVAVRHGAEPGKQFAYYVDELEKRGLITGPMRGWVDEIRELGNDANHELPEPTEDQAKDLVNFVGFLLKVVFEYPSKQRGSAEKRP